ncbi:MAG TPA: DUF2795 domain-containing protein [Ktedonobacterales bacterium]
MPQRDPHDGRTEAHGDSVPAAAVQSALKGAHYPASKQDLVKLAQQNNASDPLLDKIRELPGNQFNGPQDVMKAFGQIQ